MAAAPHRADGQPAGTIPAHGAWRLGALEISKHYGEAIANDGVSLDLRSGEIHAVLGENGAGKSTIMKILYGMEIPDGGRIELDDRVLTIASPRDAISAGIGMVHQHFMQVPTLTVLENLILGTPLAGRFMVRKKAIRQRLRDLARRYRIEVDLDAEVADLSVGAQQRVEVLKALVRGARALILDEPTAVLTPQEVESLGRTLQDLAREGHGIFVVTHKLAEVMKFCDRVSVMRRGRLVQTWPVSAVSADELVTQMVGRSLRPTAAREEQRAGRPVVQLAEVHVAGHRGRTGLRGVNLTVAAGEILGVAGVDGNGQHELVAAITGHADLISGTVLFEGTAIDALAPAARLAAGIAHVPEDRHRDAVVLDFPLTDNAILIDHARPDLQWRGLLDRGAITRFTEGLIASFSVLCSGPNAPMRSLSGGNQQRLVLARELARDPKLLIVMQPTRGLDVGAIEEVHRRLLEQRGAGMAILLISADLDEITALSDRVAVLRDGTVAGILAQPTADIIGPLMLGPSSPGMHAA